jgi:uncharacterized protein Yka (UPF0111/DUF47 family)
MTADADSDAGFGDRLVAQTDTYLEPLTDCVRLLPELLAQYEDDADTGETVERIEDLESECDQIHREITALITNGNPSDIGIRNTRLNYNQSGLVEFYRTIDVMANLTERIAHEITMMRPPHDNDCFAGLREMAEEVASMMSTLEDVVERFVHNLSDIDASDSFAGDIQSIRDAESRCDAIKNSVIETAFNTDGIDQPLMYRELAILVDDLANTMEDVTDQIITISSDEPGIVTETGPDGE